LNAVEQDYGTPLYGYRLVGYPTDKHKNLRGFFIDVLHSAVTNGNEKVLMWIADKTKNESMRFPQTKAWACIAHRHLFASSRYMEDLAGLCDEIQMFKICGFEFDLQYITNKCCAAFGWKTESFSNELRRAVRR